MSQELGSPSRVGLLVLAKTKMDVRKLANAIDIVVDATDRASYQFEQLEQK